MAERNSATPETVKKVVLAYSGGLDTWVILRWLQETYRWLEESHMGPPPSLTRAQQKEAMSRRAQAATLDELARSYNVSQSTISRLTV